MGTANKLPLTLPYTDTELVMELRISVEADAEGLGTERRLSRTAAFDIVNRTAVRLQSPAPGNQVIAGSVTTLETIATMIDGTKAPAEVLSYALSNDNGAAWTALVPDNGNQVTWPGTFGEYLIRASVTDPVTGTRTVEQKLFVTEGYDSHTVDFGPETAGEMKIHPESGLNHGFNKDHSHLGFESEYYDLHKDGWENPELVKDHFIVLERGGEFNLALSSGLYRVEILTGFTKWREEHFADIEGIVVSLPEPFKRGMHIITAEVQVTDGFLTIKGSFELPLAEITVMPLAEPSGSPPIAVTDEDYNFQSAEPWDEDYYNRGTGGDDQAGEKDEE